MLIDSHCHLDYFEEPERSAVVARARAAGVGGMVTIATRLSASESLRRIAAEQEVWATVGVHPHNAGESWSGDSGEGPSPESIAAETAYPRVVGIGESGLDYFYDKSPRAAQQAGFRAHIRAARLAGVPLVIHARDADADVAAILREEWEDGAFTFLLHCFSSGPGLAAAALALGGYISFSGILTFPRSEALRAIAREVPVERLLVETDSPYLAPVPLRGRRCEPAYVVHTAAVLAAVRGLSPAALADLTTANFHRLFTRAA